MLSILTFCLRIQVSLGGNALFVKFGHIILVSVVCMKTNVLLFLSPHIRSVYKNTTFAFVFSTIFVGCFLLQCNIAQSCGYLYLFV